MKDMAVWVMTFSREWDSVTMWDCLHHEQFTLTGRIKPDEVKKLKAYLVKQTLTK